MSSLRCPGKRRNFQTNRWRCACLTAWQTGLVTCQLRMPPLHAPDKSWILRFLLPGNLMACVKQAC